MPGFDRTGPRGEGPMTGWGLGYCGTPAGRRRVRSWPFRQFRGGRQRGWRNRYYYTGIPGWAWWQRGEFYGPEITVQEEIKMLQDEAKNLERELKNIQKTISDLKEKETKNKNKQDE
jgi:hypothetical protein